MDKPKEVNEVIKVMNDPGYDELQEENTWLRGSLREARRGGERGADGADVYGAVFDRRNAAGVDMGRDHWGGEGRR